MGDINQLRFIQRYAARFTGPYLEVGSLDYGRKIAEDEPRSIVRNPEVIKAYLGERYAREHAGELGIGGER